MCSEACRCDVSGSCVCRTALKTTSNESLQDPLSKKRKPIFFSKERRRQPNAELYFVLFFPWGEGDVELVKEERLGGGMERQKDFYELSRNPAVPVSLAQRPVACCVANSLLPPKSPKPQPQIVTSAPCKFSSCCRPSTN